MPKWVVLLMMTAVLGVLPLPAFAAKHAKPTGACAQQGGRCVSDCDQLGWCQVYSCIGGQSTPVPLWRCFEPSGLCLAPRCAD